MNTLKITSYLSDGHDHRRWGVEVGRTLYTIQSTDDSGEALDLNTKAPCESAEDLLGLLASLESSNIISSSAAADLEREIAEDGLPSLDDADWVRQRLIESGETQARFAGFVGISLDRLKRLMGTKPSNPRDPGRVAVPSLIEREAIERAVREAKRPAIDKIAGEEGKLISEIRTMAAEDTSDEDCEVEWDGTLMISRHRDEHEASGEANCIIKTMKSGRVADRYFMAGYTGFYPAHILVVVWP